MSTNTKKAAATASKEANEGPFQETGIYDCRGKERVLIKQVGGDLAIKVVDENDKTVFESWFMLKKPSKTNYIKILELLKKVSKLLVPVQQHSQP
jgi:hypothetical protein